MRHRIRGLCLLGCCLLLPLLWSGQSHAEEDAPRPAYIDLTEDQSAYGQTVAQLNIKAEQSLRKNGKEQNPRFAVLCRTDGRDFAFDAWGVHTVVAGPGSRFTLYFTEAAAADRCVRELNRMSGIRYAELDGEVWACGEDDKEAEEETHSFASWAAQEMGFGPYLDYTERWGEGEAVIAIVDSGIAQHPDLAPRIWALGYDYVDGDDDPSDLYGHGTNVAGVAADCTAGQPVYFYPIRVLNEKGGGKVSNVTNGVLEATAKGVDVINLSLEAGVPSTEADARRRQALDDAILDAVSEGITVVIAAGNHSTDTAEVYPAHLEEAGVIVVGAMERSGARSSYSNYGASVDLYTYGTSISCCSMNGGYTKSTGTSLASPHIAGLAALLRLIHSELSPVEIEARILSATDPTLELSAPELARVIPARLGFRLSLLRLCEGDDLALPPRALPETALEAICYQSSDETILTVEDGLLIPHQAGTVSVTASCTGFEPYVFEVRVEDGSAALLRLPVALSAIEDEAFRGDTGIGRAVLAEGVETLGNAVFADCGALRLLTLPESLSAIGDNDFSGAVILCPAESFADSYAQEHTLDYVLLTR